MNNNIVHLPPYEIKYVVSGLSETQNWGLKELGVPEIWSKTRGKGIVVLIIDTGMPDHIDLVDGILSSQCKSFVKGEDVLDYQGHSTHCAGIIGARENGIGVIGVAPECTIVTYKALNRDGVGSPTSVVDALRMALLLKPNIISMSLGSPAPDDEEEKLIQQLYTMNIPIICAAGNEGTAGTGYPANYKQTISIGAYDKNEHLAPFSSIGKVDFASPGVDIYSTYLKNKYVMMSGTSMACPFVAGIVALLLAKHIQQEKETGENDCKTIPQIVEHLKKYSVDKGPIGVDNYFGYGIIEVSKMINETAETTDPDEQWIVKFETPWYKKLWNKFSWYFWNKPLE